MDRRQQNTAVSTKSNGSQNLPRVLMICGISRKLHINGGVGIYVTNMARELRNLGHSVDLIWKEDFGLRPDFQQVLTPFVVQFLIAGKLARHQFRSGFDVVHIHAGDGCVWGVLRKLLGRSGPAFVWSTHGLEALTLPLYRRYAGLGIAPSLSRLLIMGYRIMIWRSGVSARVADCTITSTRTNAEWLRQHYRLDDSRLAVISSGVRPDFLELPRPFSPRIEHTLFLGTWWWRKGHWLVREAFSELAPQYPSLHLHLWGARIAEEDVRREFPEALRNRIHVRPTFQLAEYLEQLPRFQAFLLPSLYEGGTPLAVLEAIAAGLPCVVSDAPGIKDVVGQPPVASLAEPGDARSLAAAWRKVLDDPQAAYEMGLRARERARQFTWDKVAGQLSELYCRLVASRQGKR